LSALIQALRYQAGSIESSRAIRRALLAEVAGLDAIIDEAIGESFAVRARAAALQEALSGLFSAMSSWRTIESHLGGRPRLATETGRRISPLGTAGPRPFPAPCWLKPQRIQPCCVTNCSELAARFWIVPPPIQRRVLLLDQTGKALLGLAQTMNGIALLRVPSSAKTVVARSFGRTFDPLVASLNGLRVVLAIAAGALFWIFSQWPDGPTFIIFIVIVSLFYTKQDEQAFDAGLSMTLGCVFAAAGAGVLKFFCSPRTQALRHLVFCWERI